MFSGNKKPRRAISALVTSARQHPTLMGIELIIKGAPVAFKGQGSGVVWGGNMLCVTWNWVRISTPSLISLGFSSAKLGSR